MNSRQLRILSLIALAVVAVAVWIGFARKPSTQGDEQSAALYPALQGQLGKVQAIQIYQPGDQLAAELTRSDSGWILKQRFGYAADKTKVNALLLSLESAKLREEKTNNQENYATLGVQDVSSTEATGARIELAGFEPAIKLIVGKSDASAKASYVRRAGEATSWLTNELSVATDTTSWLHRDLLNISADRVQEVAVQLNNSPRYSTVKAKRTDPNFDVTPLPKKRELNSVSAANSVAQALTALQLDDVRPMSELGSVKSSAQTRFSTFDGLVLDVTGYTLDDKQWVTVKASFDATLAKRFETPTDASDKARIESEALNKQLGNWAYAIAPYKYDAIFKPVDQLLKKP